MNKKKFERHLCVLNKKLKGKLQWLYMVMGVLGYTCWVIFERKEILFFLSNIQTVDDIDKKLGLKD